MLKHDKKNAVSSNKSKKIFIAAISIILYRSLVLFLVIFLCTRIIPWYYFSYTTRWKYVADYENYKDEFNLVRDYVYEIRSGDEEGWFLVSNSEKYGRTLFDPRDNNYLSMPDEVSNALAVIDKEAFKHKDAQFDVIRYRHNDIAFCIRNGRYALVYSPDGKLDIEELLLRSEQIDSLKHKRISDDWYHVLCD